jgi:outer membrane protein assembly factor BamB
MKSFPTVLLLTFTGGALLLGAVGNAPVDPSKSKTKATDWPTFRGADRQDISKDTGLLKQWPEGGPKQLWVYDNAGLGYSGFAVVSGTLYTMGARDAAEYLIALDANTGKEKWVAEVGPLLTNGWGNGPRSSPTVDGDRVYAMGGKGELGCFSTKDGKKLWSLNMTSEGGKVPGWGYTESVLVDGPNVICTPGGPKGAVMALDKMTGKKVWQSAEWTEPAQYSSIIAVDHNGARQYLQHTSTTFAGVNAKDGKVLWKVDFPGKTAVIPTAIYKDSKAYMSAGYGAGCVQVDIGPGNTVKEVYANTNMVNHHGGVVLVGDYLYGYSDKGGWTCQDWKTGDVKWAEKKLGKGAITCADGKLYLLEENTGKVVLIDASPDGWKEHGSLTVSPQTTQRSPKGKIWTHPVVSNGKLYLRDQEYVYCYDVKG